MKYIYKLLLFISLSFFSHAGGYEYTCNAQYLSIKGDKKLYEIPEILKKVYVTFVDNKLDAVKFRTKNQSSYYEYLGRLKSLRAIVYVADNGNRMAFDSNHGMVIVISNGDLMKFVCPKINISIEKIK